LFVHLSLYAAIPNNFRSHFISIKIGFFHIFSREVRGDPYTDNFTLLK
jgi:hypothetical protein